MKEKRIHIDVPSLWLALAVILLTTLQPFLCSITMLAIGGTISPFLQGLYGVIGILAAAVAFMLYFGYRKRPQGFGFRVVRGLPILMVELWVVCVFIIWRTGWFVLGELAPITWIMNLNLIMILSIVWIVLGLLAEAVMFHWMIHISWESNGKIGFGASLLHLIRHPLTLLAVAFLVLLLPLISVASGFASGLIGLETDASFLTMIVGYLMEAVGYYFVLQFLFSVLRRRERKDMEIRKEQEKESCAEEKKAIQWVSCGVAAILVIAGGLYQNADMLFESKQERVFAVIEEQIALGEEKVVDGSVEAAMQEIQKANAMLQAVDAYINETSTYDISGIYAKNKQDPLIGSIYLLKTGNIGELEQRLRTGELGEEWYPVMLDYYKTQDELTEQQQALRAEMLQICIAHEIVTAPTPLLLELEAEKLSMRKEMETYTAYMKTYEGLGILTTYGKNGGVNRDVVEQALQLAESNPENISLQYMACIIGSSFQSDEATHYGRTMEAAARFDGMYEKTTRDVGKLALEKSLMGQVALQCYDYEAAKWYYDTAYDLDAQTEYALQSALCSERLGDYSTCFTMAKNAVEKDPVNDQALYLQCISALKMQDTQAALEAAQKLSDLIETGKTEDVLAAEQRLYICAQYLSMNDDSYWTDYTYCVYANLSENQQQELQKHDLLWNYMTAIYECFMKKDNEKAMEAVSAVLSVREDLNYAWYLKGTILSNQGEHESALEAFKRAEAINGELPATLFSIANTYDALGEYELSYQYCQRIAVMMPEVDHGNDLYGIIYHNQKLMDALKKELGIAG